MSTPQAYLGAFLVLFAMYASAQIGLDRATTFLLKQEHTHFAGFRACVLERGDKEQLIYVKQGQKCPVLCQVRP